MPPETQHFGDPFFGSLVTQPKIWVSGAQTFVSSGTGDQFFWVSGGMGDLFFWVSGGTGDPILEPLISLGPPAIRGNPAYKR